MTKQYMKFEEFKQLILEDGETGGTEETILPGGIFWTVAFKDSTSSSSLVDGTLYYYYAIRKNIKRTSELRQSCKDFLFAELKNGSRYKITGINKWESTRDVNEKDITDKCSFKDEYNLYLCEEKFTTEKNESKKEEFKRQCTQYITQFLTNTKLYVGGGSILKDGSKEVTDPDAALRLVNKYIGNMINKPESFVGWEQIKTNFQDLLTMGTGEFLVKYGGKNILTAWIIKMGLNLVKSQIDKRKKSRQSPPPKVPAWNNELDKELTHVYKGGDFTGEKNIWMEYDLSETITNYDSAKNDIRLSVSCNPNNYTICNITGGRFIFRGKPEVKKYTITFVLSDTKVSPPVNSQKVIELHKN